MSTSVRNASLVFASLIALWVSNLAMAQAPAARAITHEDLWQMPRVGAPVLSPDGRWVVVSVTEPSYDEKKQVADLWLLPTDGKAPARRVTQTPGRESGIHWAPDSRRLLFSARRGDDEAEQLYLLDLAGGEARRLTTQVGGARNGRFSPDGRSIAFETSAWPGTLDAAANKAAQQARKDRKFNTRVYTGFPIRNWDRWLDERQPRLLVMREEAAGGYAAPRDLLAGTRLLAEPGFAGVTTDGGEELDAIWTPDGTALVFTASVDRNRAAYAFTTTALFRVAVAGGEPQRLTPAGASYAAPQFTPDGRLLLAKGEVINEQTYNLSRVVALDWPKVGAPRWLTANFDRSVTRFAPTVNSRRVYLLAEEAGHEKLFVVPTTGAAVTRVFEMNRGVYTNLAIAPNAGRDVLVASFESATAPPEIVRIDPGLRLHRPLSNFATARAATLDLAPAETFWHRSRAGRDLHNLLIKPPGFDAQKKYPLLVVIHGGPHTMWRDQWVLRWNYHLLAAPGYVVLLTNYSGSTGFGENFARHVQGDPLRTLGDEINEAADAALARYPFIDAARQCAGGASYGGHLANWLQATTTRYRCLVSHAGLVNLESQWGTSDIVYGREINNGGPVWEQGAVWREQNPIRYAARFQTPVLVTVGEQDFRVPLNNTLEYWTVLQRRQIESRLVVFPDENHWILKGENSRVFYREIHDWLARWLK
jgi:dipeptidyl aminopeptidase/acylaminoacyl peptidase